MLNRALFDKGDVVAVAFSGGKDSACLFDLLYGLQDQLSITVKAINIDHGIRGETSIRDSSFVKSVCAEKGVELKFYRLDCKQFSSENGYSEEEGARILRYKCFLDAIESGFCTKVATAHHASDSAETVLFNLFRGASTAGVTGIDDVALGGKIIRPLASVTRERIDEYVASKKIRFVTDETNLSDEYSRNFIRNRVLPLIKERFPEVEKSVCRFAEISAKENLYLDGEARRALTRDGEAIYIDLDSDDCVLARAIVVAMKELGIGKDYVKAHVDSVSALKHAKTSTEIVLPKGVKAIKEYDRIALYRRVDTVDKEVKFAIGEIDGFGARLAFLPKSQRLDGENKVLRFDADKLPDGAVIRYRRVGDEFTKFGGGTKKLNDYFTDKKIPNRLRDCIPLVCVGSRVYIICGIEISDLVRVDKDAANVLQCIYVAKS